MPSRLEHTHNLAAQNAKLIRPFMPELDMLRGVAVLGVLLLHAFYWKYGSAGFGPWSAKLMEVTRFGWTGVNLFFVLSGFLITGILLDSKEKPLYYRRFYTRRALRILPAYYALLILLLLLRTSSVAFVGLSFVYLANMTEFFGVSCAYGPLWSLAVEEHFYIVWPAVVRRVSMRRLAVISGSILIVVPVLRSIAFLTGHAGGLDWYTWFVADGLATGSLLSVILRGEISRTQVWRLCWMLFAGAAVLGVAGEPLGIATRNRLLGAALQYSTINAMCASVLLLFLLAGTSAAKGYVNISWLRFLGYLSYGLYLDHLLAFRIYDWACARYFPRMIPSGGDLGLVVMRFALAGGGAIAAAYGSRKYFEERFLRLKDSLVPKTPDLQEPAATLAAVEAKTQVA